MHTPVLLEEVLRYLDPQPNEDAIDATVDGGGHARAILEKIAPGGRLLGIDRDQEMFREAKANLAGFGDRAIVAHGNFAHIATIAKDAEVLHPSCILFDLGMSSYHLASERGFSFQHTSDPLDMRFDSGGSLTAEALINHAPFEELAKIFSEYGEYPRAERLVRVIVDERKRREFKTVGDLLSLFGSWAIPGRSPVARPMRRMGLGRTHPATRIFQALRIAVNDEFSHIETAIREAFRILEPGGRLAIISFHSLEDRIAKTFMKEVREEAEILTPKPVGAGREEVSSNPRSRSAKLRAIKKTDFKEDIPR